MKKPPKKTADHRIVYLNHDEITNPIHVAHDFFSSLRLTSHLKMLRQWRNDAAFASETPKKGDPSSLLYRYELTIKLLEAAWLLKDKKPGGIKINSEKETNLAKWRIKTERKHHDDYPEHLSLQEIIKPSTVIKQIFKKYSLNAYRKILNTWLHDALSNSFMEESLTKAEVIIVYEQLVKLFEVMWLISERVKVKNLI
jgi:hypothetical protein